MFNDLAVDVNYDLFSQNLQEGRNVMVISFPKL
jgi:hypothetical protein